MAGVEQAVGFCVHSTQWYIASSAALIVNWNDHRLMSQHPLTAMFDQSRVIVSSTTYCQGSQAEQLQWISRSICWYHVCVQETLLTLVAPDTASFWVHYCKVHYSKIMPLLCQCHQKTTTTTNLICKPNMERRLFAWPWPTHSTSLLTFRKRLHLFWLSYRGLVLWITVTLYGPCGSSLLLRPP